MNNRRDDPLRLSGRANHLLRKAETLIVEARSAGADLHPCARHFLERAELLLASGRIEMGRDDGRLAATFAYLASEEAERAIAVCGFPHEMSPSPGSRREEPWR